MTATPGLPAFAPRAPLLAADLAALGIAMPEPLPFAPGSDPAAGWGVFYVVEGSRLGGAMLARQVPAGWPSAYLAATHGPGGWRAVRTAIDRAGEAGGAGWLDAATEAAQATFRLYERATVA